MLFLLLLVSILFSLSNFKQKKILAEKVDELCQVEQEKRSLLDLVYGNMKMHYAYSEFHFQDFILLNKDRNKVKFSSIIDNGTKVIYKFSSSNCSSCIRSGLTSIQKLIREIPENHLVIIADGSTRRELQALSNSLHLDYPIYLAEEGTFDATFYDSQGNLLSGKIMGTPGCFAGDGSHEYQNVFQERIFIYDRGMQVWK